MSTTTFFETVPVAPPDAIFGLLEAFARDPRRDKIDLSAGVYTDGHGRTPVMEAVRAAERRLAETETTKTYLPISGLAAFNDRVARLVLGDSHPALAEDRLAVAQTPGGTGALRAVGELLRLLRPEARVWISDPTWANHAQVFNAAGLKVETYPYLGTDRHTLAFEAMCGALARARPGDAVVLHAVCHNPTGIDPSPAQWGEIARRLAESGALPLVDFAYQGFARDLERDAEPVRRLARELPEVAVCSSFSKTFGLYRERVGALMVATASPRAAQAVASQVKKVIRAAWSNPPCHGGAVVAEILADAELDRCWRAELGHMRERIAAMRRALASGLDAHGVGLSSAGNGFLEHQRGMFSFTGLGREQVDRLREEHAIYLVGSGRINVAGLSEQTVDRVCAAVASVL